MNDRPVNPNVLDPGFLNPLLKELLDEDPIGETSLTGSKVKTSNIETLNNSHKPTPQHLY